MTTPSCIQVVVVAHSFWDLVVDCVLLAVGVNNHSSVNKPVVVFLAKVSNSEAVIVKTVLHHQAGITSIHYLRDIKPRPIDLVQEVLNAVKILQEDVAAALRVVVRGQSNERDHGISDTGYLIKPKRLATEFPSSITPL